MQLDSASVDLAASIRTPRLVSVLLPTLNAANTVGEQLEALTRQTYEGPWEIILGDNASTDATLEIVGSFHSRLPQLRTIHVTKRRKASVLNACLNEAAGDFLACCDADDIVDPGWLNALAQAAERCELVGGFCEVRALNDPLVQRWRSPFPSDELPNIFRSMKFAVGCNTGVWSDVARAVGGWNEAHRGVGEDVDLALRVQFAGYKMCFCPDAVVHYRFRTTIRGTVRQAYKFGLAEPQLYKEFRAKGLARPNLLRSIGVWGFLLLTLPLAALSKARRGAWLLRLAHRWGRVVGSLEARTLVL